MLIVSQIFLNLFIAIILEGFDDSKQDMDIRIDEKMIKAFQEAWSQHGDPNATGFIPVQSLRPLILQLIEKKTGWIRGG
jgi:hypothetical protein